MQRHGSWFIFNPVANGDAGKISGIANIPILMAFGLKSMKPWTNSIVRGVEQLG
jgi:hypothetical protein